jgi:predicted nucleic acid-binding protein
LYRKYLPKLGLEIIALPSCSWETVKNMKGVIAAKDLPVLASAIACNADYLITGDKKDFDKLKSSEKYSPTIESPAEFVESVFAEIIKNAYE